MSDDTTDQVSFSMDIVQLQEIFRLIQRANEYYLSGMYGDSFEAMKTCKFCFIQSLTEQERKSLVNLENEMKQYLVAYKLNQARDDWELTMDKDAQARLNKKLRKKIPLLQEKLEQYRTAIMDLLDAYGYLSKKKKDKTKLSI